MDLLILRDKLKVGYASTARDQLSSCLFPHEDAVLDAAQNQHKLMDFLATTCLKSEKSAESAQKPASGCLFVAVVMQAVTVSEWGTIIQTVLACSL